MRELDITWEKTNPNGGGISLGHPIGCTGARMTVTAMYEMKRRNGRYGLITITQVARPAPGRRPRGSRFKVHGWYWFMFIVF